MSDFKWPGEVVKFIMIMSKSEHLREYFPHIFLISESNLWSLGPPLQEYEVIFPLGGL